MQETINQRIRRYRENTNLTQKQVAELLGIKGSTYSQMERKGKISSEIILKLEKIFGLEEGVLLYGEKKNEEYDFSALKNNNLTLKKPAFAFEVEDQMVLSRNEKNYIRILRSLPKEDYNEVITFLDEKYKKNK